jgi:hypothetical protein
LPIIFLPNSVLSVPSRRPIFLPPIFLPSLRFLGSLLFQNPIVKIRVIRVARPFQDFSPNPKQPALNIPNKTVFSINPSRKRMEN